MSNQQDDELIFEEEDVSVSTVDTSSHPKGVDSKDLGCWKMLVVDDDEIVHQMTRFVLEDYTYQGQSLEIVSTYSAEQTREELPKHPDAAIMLLDVVMETPDAGLKLVEYIRETLNNRFISIILRTGQPGQAIEAEVIHKYAINDYKEKTELTSQKLYTSITSGLRAYENLIEVESLRQHLEEKVAERTQELQHRNMELHSLNQLKSEFLHLATQGLKDPLSNIQGLSYQIKTGFDRYNKDKIVQFASEIETSSVRMYTLVKRLLDVEMLEKGEYQVNTEPFELRETVEQLAAAYQDRASIKHIELVADLPEMAYTIQFDKHILLSVLDNLLSNAVKFSYRYKKIIFRVEPPIANTQDFLRCQIIDEGPGLSVDEQAQLYNKFSRLTPQPTGGEYCTGLGLYLVKSLVDAIGGRISCESELHKGTQFTVDFPVS